LANPKLAELDRLLTMPPETRFKHDPVGWAVQVLQIPSWSLRWSELPEYQDHVWDGTPDPIATMLEAIARGENVGVESATGTGKTFAASIAALHYQATRRNSRVVTAAPKENQLTDLVWMEIGKHFPKYQARYPMAEMVSLRVRMDTKSDAWNIIGWVTGTAADEEVASKARGLHAEDQLILMEEMTGIPVPVMRAFEMTQVGEHNVTLGLGNPDAETDALHQWCTSPGVTHIRISALDHPNVVTGRDLIPGACTRKSVARMEAKYKRDTPWMYESRVRGICPTQSSSSLIQAEWVERAFALWEQEAMHRGPLFRGVDVANSEAGDKGAIAYGSGRAIRVESFPCPSAVGLGDQIATEFAADGVDPRYVAVDTAGIGASTADQARRRGYRVQSFNGGPDQLLVDGEIDLTPEERKVASSARFKSKRGQAYWALREDLQAGRLALRPDAQLKRELITPTFQSRGGFILVESKDDIKKRLGNSPDKADAVVYANWVRPRRREREEEAAFSAFDPKVLQAEYDAKYRFRSGTSTPIPVGDGY
jgi:phage terminase large subunit